MDQNLCLNDNSICDCAFGIAKELSENPELYALFQRMENFDIQTFITSFMEETGEYVSSLREAQVVDTWKHRIEKSITPCKNIQSQKFDNKSQEKLN